MPSDFYLGGLTPFNTGWLGPRAVYIDFVSDITTDYYQLYAGRKKIGSTSSPRERRLIGQLVAGEAPATLTIVRVPPRNRLVDYGDRLPAVPWARYVLEWSALNYPSDAVRFDVTASTEPGGAPDPDNIVGVVRYTDQRAYSLLLPPLPESGEWTYRITPRDDAEPSGNAGTVTDVVVDAELPPPDLTLDADGNRFSLAVDAGELVASFSY